MASLFRESWSHSAFLTPNSTLQGSQTSQQALIPVYHNGFSTVTRDFEGAYFSYIVAMYFIPHYIFSHPFRVCLLSTPLSVCTLTLMIASLVICITFYFSKDRLALNTKQHE